MEGFYVAPAPDHYRRLTCYLPKRRSGVIADTVKFIPRYIPIPETSLDDHVKKTTDDSIHLLLHKLPAILALTPESSRQALIHLAQVLQRENLPTIIPVPPSTLQQLPPRLIKDVMSKGAVKQNTTLTTLTAFHSVKYFNDYSYIEYYFKGCKNTLS